MKRLSRIGLLVLHYSLLSNWHSVYASPDLNSCSGYNAENMQVTDGVLTADLFLAGDDCAVYGPQLKRLALRAEYQSTARIRVKISDPFDSRYQVPEQIITPPSRSVKPGDTSLIKFRFISNPFSFSIVREETNEILFNTLDHPLIFSPQYIRLKTSLPANPNIYGLGEHTESFRLPTQNTTRTLWNRDSIRIPTGTNLYSSQPVYFDHRATGTHGVFLLNSNGMDIKLTEEEGKASLEYNILGGVLDLYFFGGRNPVEVAQQYAEIVGRPAEVPYWSFGLHQCRFGYKDVNEVAQVVANYSAAGIPLETMWIDIDYMDDRLVFTTDPNNYPKAMLRKVVDDLHKKDQRFVMMVDPAIGTRPGQEGSYMRGSEADVWLKGPDGNPHIGIVWPGTVVFPDWFHPEAQAYWTNEFKQFFDPANGLDIDGVWIDMNEPASFCYHPCTAVIDQVNITEVMLTLGTVPGLEPSQRTSDNQEIDLHYPPYAIKNDLPRLSDRTVPVDVVHHNGLLEYDTHNLYGSMMSIATREAMLARKPTLRPFLITRSTFAGIGSKAGKWLGDNASDWVQYRLSIAGMLGFTSIYQVPMVGSDVCGFVDNTTETLCARWAMLGAFSPFYRNHNDIASIPQEFYRWPTVARAAKAAIDIRYKLLDYLYTAFHKAHLDGTPVVQPLFFAYPKDRETYGVEHQFLFGDSIVVCPILEEGDEVEIYLPEDIFYELITRRPVEGPEAKMWVRQVAIDEIPLLIKGGSIIPSRMESAMTTTELRKKDFEIIVAPGLRGTAEGSLYIDDGVSLEQTSTLDASYLFDGSRLTVSTTGKFNVGTVSYARISILGIGELPFTVNLARSDGSALKAEKIAWEAENEVLIIDISIPLSESFTVDLSWERPSTEGGKEQAHLHDEL